MTNFIDVYSRAMTLLKSPILSRLQDNDLYSYCIIMGQYLDTAITFYNPNPETYIRVSDRTESIDGFQSFEGDGEINTFILTGTILPTDESIFKVTIDDEDTKNYTFENSTKSIVFDSAPEDGSNIDVSWITTGNFNSLTNEDITLLAMAICWAWAIQTQNNLLDIDRQPSDSDFKLHAEGTTIKGKIDWVKYYEEMFKRELSRADWRPLFRRER